MIEGVANIVLAVLVLTAVTKNKPKLVIPWLTLQMFHLIYSVVVHLIALVSLYAVGGENVLALLLTASSVIGINN